jgi:ferredoxin
MAKAVLTDISAVGLLERDRLDDLIQTLAAAGYTVIGPSAEGRAISYQRVQSVIDLPAGWRSRQDAGRYRLERRTDEAVFGYVSGAESWKRFLFQPSRTLWRGERTDDGFSVTAPDEPAPKLAFLGARACEIAGMQLQDRVFIEGDHPDPDYQARREAAFIVAVHCTEAGDTCFCASMNTGPATESGYDLALTELLEEGRHVFLVQTGSRRGEAIAAQLPLTPAKPSDIKAAETGIAQAAASMGRTLETGGLKDLIQQNQEHPHWDEVAARCLACANCTAVCPTCFCHTTEDTTDLEGLRAERHQRWDSCFSLDFSHLTHGPVRSGVKARYRQWMSHKLAHWVDQFGEFGCVGCGRCVTWCPAGIDITAEAAALRLAVEGGE